ncbi:MAG: SDR family NAD(P)-dependent oxidoreductase [Fulvivirga sp.]
MILVTGATGFLGSYICRKLLDEKLKFIALKRPSSSLALLEDVKDQITWHEGDITKIDSIDSILDKIDTVIHSAAIVSFHHSEYDLMTKVNVEGTKNLVNSCLNYGINKMIFVSSVAALGRSKAEGAIDETNKWQESKYNTHYGESKYLAELEVWRGHVEGLQSVILNPSVILGPGDWNNSSSSIFKYVWDEKPFYTEGYINYVDVRDVTSILYKLLKSNTIGERYIVNAGKVTFKSMFDKIALRFNKKQPKIKATGALVKIGLFLAWLKYIFTKKKPVITRETARVGKTQIYFDNSKVVSELNHTFVPLDETLDWACSHYLDNKK